MHYIDRMDQRALRLRSFILGSRDAFSYLVLVHVPSFTNKSYRERIQIYTKGSRQLKKSAEFRKISASGLTPLELRKLGS